MARKFFAGLLIALSAILLVAGIVAIGAIWFYNERITTEAATRLTELDDELAAAEAGLASSEQELARALRVVDAADKTLRELMQETEGAANFFEYIQSTLDDRLIPELKQARTRIVSAREELENLQGLLEGLGRLIPGINLNLPGPVLTDLIASANSLDTEIGNIEIMAARASLFVSDTSYIMGGDLSETRDSLQNFLTTTQEYQERVAGWREQTQQLIERAPAWIDQASIVLTIFLLWFSLSQFGLLLHGLSIQRGADPWLVLRRAPKDQVVITEEENIDLELGA